MAKLRIVGVALVAVFAFGALTAASASAAPTFLLALWLINGGVLNEVLLVESVGELLLEDSNVPILGKAMVLCSGILDGWVGPESLDYITEVLYLSGTAVSTTALSGEALVCTNQENCPEPLVWAINLGWDTELELLEQSGLTVPWFVILLLSENGADKVGWEIECMGLSTTDECTASQGAARLTLSGTELIANFSNEINELAEEKFASCSVGGSESGLVEGGGPIVPDAGTLSASSKGATEEEEA